MRITAGLILEANVLRCKAVMNIYKSYVCQLIQGMHGNDIYQDIFQVCFVGE